MAEYRKNNTAHEEQEGCGYPSNYRPITCLCTTFKLMTAIIADTIQNHLYKYNLIPEEQKGNRRNSRGTKDQLLIDKMILRNSRRRKTNLHVAWIDYKKAFDSLPHRWIAKCLQIVGVSGNIRQFLRVVMTWWKTVLTVNGQILDYVHIRRGIFQGDSLSPLFYVITIIPMTTILGQTGIRIPNFQVSNKDFPPTLHGWPQSVWKVIKWVIVATHYSTDIQHWHLNAIRPREMCNTDNTQRKSNPHWRAHIVKQQHHQKRAESRRELK